MKQITLLSEVHPYIETVNPTYSKNLLSQNILAQAKYWHNLFTKEDIQNLLSKLSTIEFLDITKMILDRTNQLGTTLVLRDWTHLDFTAMPFLSTMSLELRTAKIFEDNFNVIQATSVRHPIDQWLSMRNLKILKDLEINFFLKGYKAFAEKCKEIGFIRYEDFTINPDKELKTICNMLQIDFDPNYISKWFDYKKITGDIANNEVKKILPYKKKKTDKNILRIFEQNSDYQKIIDILGYK